MYTSFRLNLTWKENIDITAHFSKIKEIVGSKDLSRELAGVQDERKYPN